LPDLTAAGIHTFFRIPPFMGFRQRPPYLAAPPVATVVFAAVVVLPPPLGEPDVDMLVDEQRAPFHGASSRLSASNTTNALNPPLIPPYPSRQKYFTDIAPASLSERNQLRKHIRLAEREILVLEAYI
jgi:hypothetical protein